MMGLALIGRGGPRPRRFAGIALAAMALAGASAPAADAAAPANDAFAAAELLSGADATVKGTTVDATREDGEVDRGDSGGRSVWYRWVAPFTGTATVTHTDANWTSKFVIYTGAALDDLTTVEGNNPYVWNGYPRTFHAVEGTAYTILVDARYSDPYYAGEFSLSVSLEPAPANDNFAHAEVETGEAWSATGNNSAATLEPGEVFGFMGYYSQWSVAGRTIWYEWTAPKTGAATIDMGGTAVSSVLSVYSGDLIATLAPVAGTTATAAGRSLSFRAVEGSTYRIQVDALDITNPGGDVQLALSMTDLPPNDMFADAADLGSAATAGADGRTTGASAETGEPQHYPYSASGGSVWYTWTAPQRGSLTIRANASFQTVLAAYTGDTVASLTRVANQAQDYNGGLEQIRIRVEAGVTYRIAVDGLYGAGGTFSLSLNVIGSPGNDDLLDATAIAGLDAQLDGTNVGATQEPCEPVHEQNNYDPSVWYTWTAPVRGAATIDVTGQLDSVVGVYTGASVCALARVNTGRSGTKRTFSAEAGVTYRIAIDGRFARQNTFHLDLHEDLPPANDMFADATAIAGAGGTVSGDTRGATAEAGDPTPGASVWYSWTATADGHARLHFDQATFAATAAVFTGDSVGALGWAPSSFSYNTRDLTFPTKAGETYRIAVHGGWTLARGTFKLDLSLDRPPANDDFARAAPLSGGVVDVEGTNRGATREQGEPSTYSDLNSSVWYRWKAPASGTVTLDFGSSWRYASVYTGSSLEALTQVAPVWSSTTFEAVEGETYSIAVDGSSYDDPAGFRLALVQAGTPPNDAFADATVLGGSSDSTVGTSAQATREAWEPTLVDGAATAGHSLWYRWRAPASGPVAVDTWGSDFDTVLAAYTGDASGVTSVAENDSANVWGVQSRIDFEAVKGTVYTFLVDGNAQGSSSAGTVRLQLSQGSRPVNDSFSAAEELTGPASDVSTTNAGATRELGEPAHADDPGGASIWYRWTAPQDGSLTVSTSDSDFDTLLGVYTGGSVGGLTKAGAGAKEATIDVKAGTTYRIAVDGRNDGGGAAEGSTRLVLQFVEAASVVSVTPTGPNPPLDVKASFVPGSIPNVLARGFVVSAKCNRACALTYRVGLLSTVVGTAKQTGSGQRRIALNVPKNLRRRVLKSGRMKLTVHVDARAGQATDWDRFQAFLRK